MICNIFSAPRGDEESGGYPGEQSCGRVLRRLWRQWLIEWLPNLAAAWKIIYSNRKLAC